MTSQKTANYASAFFGGLLGKLMSFGILVTLILGIQKAVITVPYSWSVVFLPLIPSAAYLTILLIISMVILGNSRKQK